MNLGLSRIFISAQSDIHLMCITTTMHCNYEVSREAIQFPGGWNGSA